ncbi:MAG: hypothetical protein CM15mP120_20990 [Pseudomonadota bacterium]|nr:MAG: hypothetical protein CM15mP120_20990 [Pseudomonadota bacterium]
MWSRKLIGALVRSPKALRAAGIENNTLVIFSSDNGPWLTMNEEGGRAGLLRDGKGTTFEGGMRVPTVFSWPGKLPAGVVSDIGSALDLFPTVMTLRGATYEPAWTVWFFGCIIW